MAVKYTARPSEIKGNLADHQFAVHFFFQCRDMGRKCLLCHMQPLCRFCIAFLLHESNKIVKTREIHSVSLRFYF